MKHIGETSLFKVAEGQFTLRKATVKDVPAIARLINTYASQGQMLPKSHYQLYQDIRDFVVISHGDGLVGCGALHIIWEDLGEIRSLAVSEDWQGQGLGRLMVETLLDEARALGLPRVFALTYREGFFARLGFRVVSRESLPQKIWGDCLNCPKFANCDEIAMIFDLHEMREEIPSGSEKGRG